MRFISTDKTDNRRVAFSDTILYPIPSEGHLWIPEMIPSNIFNGTEKNLEETLNKVLMAYLTDMGIDLGLCAKRSAHEIDAQVIQLENFHPNTSEDMSQPLIEYQLWHSPTRSFKDLGCRFIAYMYTELFGKFNYRLLVATTGDAGDAIADAIAGLQGSLPVTILYPEGRIHKKQEHGMTKVSDPYHRILPIAVSGSFDDCQNDVKKLLERPGSGYLSANSISLCRLLPQIAYYGWLATIVPDAFIIVPSGNLGNAVSAVIAKKMGARISKIGVATNRNDTVVRYFRYEDDEPNPLPVHQTPASAMDIAIPSNLVRLMSLYSDQDNNDVRASVLADVAFFSICNDTAISQISKQYRKCPHTAVGILAAAEAYQELVIDTPMVVVSTASMEKFELYDEPEPADPICRLLKTIPPSYINTIILVGMPGVGKTTLVKILGGIDVDDVLSETTGSLESFIQECQTSHEFLKCEGQTFRTMLQKNIPGVIGTGGSIVHDPKTIDALLSVDPGTIVVWLYSENEMRSENDPTIIYPDGVSSLQDLRNIRIPLYEQISHLQVRTDRYSKESCAKIILNLLTDKSSLNENSNQPDYTCFSPFIINVSSPQCDSISIVTDIMKEYGIDGQINSNTTINDGRIEPGLSILFHGLAHHVDMNKKHLTTREHIIPLWKELSVRLNLRCAYVKMFGRYAGCIHGFLQTRCPGAYPVR